MADFVPQDQDDLLQWLTNLLTTVDTHGPTLGETAAEITAFKAEIQLVINALLAITAARNALAGAVSNFKTVKQAKLSKTGPIRTKINKWKAGGLMTPTIEQEMDIVGTADAFDENTYKAAITAEVHAGFVRIKFQKRGVDGLNIYVRLKGQTTWTKLTYDTNTPYDDHAPLAVAGTPEVREYRAIGVIKDNEIGQPSDIVSVTFAG